MTFLPKNTTNSFGDKGKNFRISHLCRIIPRRKPSSYTSYLLRILTLTCRQVPPLSTKFKLKAQKTSISNVHISSSTFVHKGLQKRPEIPFFALKWFYLCPSNEDKKIGFGDKTGEISTNFSEPRKHRRIAT